MSIRIKIVLMVLPLLFVSVILVSISSYFVAAGAVTRIATNFLSFKASEIEKYAESQWNLLVENGVADRPDMVQAAQAGVESFARAVIQTETELIFALNPQGALELRTGSITISENELADLLAKAQAGQRGFFYITAGGIERVASGFLFGPFNWYILTTEHRDTFYRDVDRITQQSIIILIISLVAAAVLLFAFIAYLTRPLKTVAGAMRRIIESGDLTERVDVEFQDEIGQLSHTFNLMLGELERAYNQIKRYAFDAVLAQKKEAKIRNIFQKYVPQQLIDRFFQNPESMLVGENRELAVLFSDIRSFTTISEAMRPDDLVLSLNRYFTQMVDIIMGKDGIIDKYIGDAIMAFFGAPVHHDNDAANALDAALLMVDALEEFNNYQIAQGKPAFITGIGINYGEVTVGNIGSERKMDYTVIGDMVNLASRLEGLTKPYKQPIVFSEFMFQKVVGVFPCRLLDAVAVKGKTKGVRIYTAKRTLTPQEEKAWPIHDQAMEMYWQREFDRAADHFAQVRSLLGTDDYASEYMEERCRKFVANPPHPNWNGVEVLKEK